MSIIFYSKCNNDISKKIMAILEKLVSSGNIEQYRTVEDLAERLTQSVSCQTLAIFLATTQEELLELVSLREVIHEVRMVLFVGNQEHETVKIAHTFRPRFLCDVNGNFSVCTAVLQKMLGQHHDAESQERGSFMTKVSEATGENGVKTF